MKKITLYFLFFYNILTYATPIGDSNQYFCTTNNPTIANIVVTGNPIYWFATNDNSSSQLLETDILSDNTIYYAFDSTDSNAENLSVTVHFIDPIPAPYGDSPVSLCDNGLTLADLPVFNTVGYDGIYWFSTETQDTGTELSPITELINGATYYAFQAVCSCGNNDCLGVLPITVNLIGNIPAPTGETDQYFFIENDPTFADIITFNVDDFTNIYWFLSTNQFTQINLSTSLSEGIFYAYQGLGVCSADLPVNIYLINLDGDEDGDTITNGEEDLNGDGNPANDDTDGDNIPNFLDNDDDGDNVPTSTEAVVITRDNLDINYLDTDGDLVPNYLDNDDDNDGILTIDEDYNGDGNPVNDDTNTDGIPDYLQQSVALGTSNVNINLFSVYPNPVKDIISLQLKNSNKKTIVIIYNMFGSLVYKNDFFQKNNININVSNLNIGVYFINTKVGNKISTKKFIKL